MAHTVLLFSWQQLYGEISWCLREVFTGTFSLTFWGWFGVRISERNVRASFLRWPKEAKQSSSAVLLRRGLRWWQERCSVLFQIKLYLHFDAFDVLTAEKTAFMEALAITLHFLRVVNRPVACCTLVASAPVWHGVSDKTQRWWERLNISSVPPLNFQTRVSKKKDSCVFCHIKALQDLYHNSNDSTENYSYRPQRLSQLHKQSQPWQKGRLIPRGMLAGAMPQSFCFLMSCGWRMQTLTAQKKWEINSVLSHHASP